ncbi:MAG: gamma-glutamyl-gamma-aminobutyrate hydrolase family protein, partial [Pyrinomonadaceae bacterium]
HLKLADDSLLSNLVDSHRASVNSHHHQGVLEIGHNLVPTGWAPDGLVEAIEDPRSDRFVIGVQWHPEIAWEKDPLSQKLFSRFTSEAQKFHDKKQAELFATA